MSAILRRMGETSNNKCPKLFMFDGSELSITIGITIFSSFNASRNSSLTYAEEELFSDNMKRNIFELMISALIVCSKSDPG